ncbi:MAG: hypothetical protein KC422_10565 [Trueperaceae bacterium]|nr:hypothetical protein [Trueperaceae bacterium]
MFGQNEVIGLRLAKERQKDLEKQARHYQLIATIRPGWRTRAALVLRHLANRIAPEAEISLEESFAGSC